MQLAASTKRAIKRQLRLAWLTYVRSAQPFSRQDILFGLRKVGVRPGSILLVHSSFDRFVGFVGTSTDVNQALLESVGTTGTVLMPTLPFSGTAIDYISSGAIFDARNTPSRMGLLTELFRRHQGTVRSVHPTHSVAAFGPVAEQLIADHHLARTPCGEGTPYARFLDAGGHILFMGTGIGVMTFFHHVEEKLESQLPFSPFTKDIFVLHSRDMNGNLLTTKTRLFDPHWSRKRNLNKLVPFLKQRRVWKEIKIGRLSLILLSADAVLSTCRELVQHGIYAYDS